jgi:hypothetical protein
LKQVNKLIQTTQTKKKKRKKCKVTLKLEETSSLKKLEASKPIIRSQRDYFGKGL